MFSEETFAQLRTGFINDQPFRRALTASAGSCAEIKSGVTSSGRVLEEGARERSSECGCLPCLGLWLWLWRDAFVCEGPLPWRSVTLSISSRARSVVARVREGVIN